MPRFARETTVPVERSRAEIEETLRRYNASEFHSGWAQDSSMIAFRIGNLFVRFVLPLPPLSEKRFQWRTVRGHAKRQTENQAINHREQEIRQRWRALLLVIKAKLEAVECGISTIEEEFLAHIVMPNDVTVGCWLIDQALPQIVAGQMPRLALPAPPPEKSADVIDAEFTEASP